MSREAPPQESPQESSPQSPSRSPPQSLWIAAGRALGEARRRLDELDGGEDALVEALARRTIGTGERRVRGRPTVSGPWSEEGLAVRLASADGERTRSLVARSDWHRPDALARLAIDMLRREDDGGAPSGAARPELAVPVGRPPAHLESPIDEEAGRCALDAFVAACLAADDRVEAVDRVALRQARVEAYLIDEAGRSVHQIRRTFELAATAIARDGLRAASLGEAWSGAVLDEDSAASLGRGLGEAVAIELSGVAAPPPGPVTVALAPRVVGEITLPLAGALLGAGREAGRLSPELHLADDPERARPPAQWPPVDGAGRAQRRRVLVAAGRVRSEQVGRLPFVRAGLGDAPSRGASLLAWGWSGRVPDASEIEVELVQARTLSVDSRRLTWRGVVSGHRLEAGVRRRPLARLCLTVELPDLLRRVIAGDSNGEIAHVSGLVHAPRLVVENQRLGSWTLGESA